MKYFNFKNTFLAFSECFWEVDMSGIIDLLQCFGAYHFGDYDSHKNIVCTYQPRKCKMLLAIHING